MDLFNRKTRGHNMVRTSVIVGACSIVNLVMAFAYRTVFIRMLSVQYLGVNGMFTNLLSLLSLAELGVTSAISYRLYAPVSRNDVQGVGEMMALYRRIYRIIALIVLLMGLALLPFLDFFIRDAAEVPPNVNLRLVYLLFLLNSAASYLFAYRMQLLAVDQREDLRVLVDSLTRLAIYILQLTSLLLWRNYTLTLLCAIIATIVQNAVFSAWVRRRYAPVFDVHSLPDRTVRRNVWRDMLSGGCHRLGAVVLSSTDSLVLAKFAGLLAGGLYANYALILTTVRTLLQQMLGSSTASYGSARVELSDEENHRLYQRMLFVNLTLTGFATFCIFALINDFIRVWLGPDMLLSKSVVIVLCVQFYMDTGRIVTESYINGCGLFVRDRIRPLIEAALNLVISVLLVQRIGIAGVFIGTFISYGLTGFWRAPLILCREGFHRSTAAFWRKYVLHAIFTLVCCVICSSLGQCFAPETMLGWLGKAVICAAAYAGLFLLCFHRSSELRTLLAGAADALRKIVRHAQGS